MGKVLRKTKQVQMKWRKASDLMASSDKGYVINKDIFSEFCIAYLPLPDGSRVDVGSFDSVKEGVEACKEHFAQIVL